MMFVDKNGYFAESLALSNSLLFQLGGALSGIVSAVTSSIASIKARALEQAIITAYGIDTLRNMINSISPKKWSTFKSEFQQMQSLIDSYFDPE